MVQSLSELLLESLWALSVIGLSFDLLGALIVLAPDWRSLDKCVKYIGYKLSPVSSVPLLGYPIRNLDRAYRLEHVNRKFIQEGQTLTHGDLGFEIISEIADSIHDDEQLYDVISHDGNMVNRTQSYEFQRDEPELKNEWATGTGLGGPEFEEVAKHIDEEMSALIFKIGGGFLALGFSIQIATKILENLI